MDESLNQRRRVREEALRSVNRFSPGRSPALSRFYIQLTTIMYYVYALKNKTHAYLYIGFTSNLRKRLKEHQDKKSTYTAKMGEWHFVYYEAYHSKDDAIERERMLKQHGSAFGKLRKRIKRSIDKV